MSRAACGAARPPKNLYETYGAILLWNIMVSEDGDRVRLTTKFRGPGMCLDIFNGGANNNQPHLVSCANFTGQRWTLTKTDKRVEGAP